MNIVFIKRITDIEKVLKKKSVLLFGPRRTGKSFYIQNQLSKHRYYNLLHADTYRKLTVRPSLIRESITDEDRLIVIDEIQKLPILMDEVHAMIEEFPNVKFLLTGSSARKLKRGYTSLMAGRAKRMTFYPFVSAEIPDFDLHRVLGFGTLPPVYFSDDPYDELLDYVGLYLKEEIRAEALVRNIENFSHFLEVAARSNGRVINYSQVALDAQIAPRTVREYFNLLEDTLMGYLLSPIEQLGRRKVSSKSKFYFFDTGVVNALIERSSVSRKSSEFGELFEHFIFLELKNYINAKNLRSKINYWGIANKTEVDFIIDKKIAIEVKATNLVGERHLKGLNLMSEDYELSKKYVVSCDDTVRSLNDTIILPYREFCKRLWNGEIF
jgi:predicted AAA+ superfamily ATPase